MEAVADDQASCSVDLANCSDLTGVSCHGMEETDASVDTWAGLRRLAESADQNLSPSFVRSIFHAKGGVSFCPSARV